MKRRLGLWCCVISAVGVLVVILLALNREHVTEFSPDTLLFRGATYVGGVRIASKDTWSTALLDEARAKNPMPDPDRPIRWSYVHGNNVIGRLSFSNGEAKVAYRLFRAGWWEDVLSAPNNGRDEIIKKCVDLMRQLKYDDVYDVLMDARAKVPNGAEPAAKLKSDRN